MPDAKSLKEEGNKLFLAKDFEAALSKYSKAIDMIDDFEDQSVGRAVLCANSAACYHHLKKYSSAAAAATKATEADPSYAKAWIRLATANHMLERYQHSIENWLKAIERLPAGDDRAREDCNRGLNAAREGVRAQLETTGSRSADDRLHMFTSTDDQHPWSVAKRMLPGLLLKREYRSSAWVINEANLNFTQAVDNMFATTYVGDRLSGMPNTIDKFSNAILMDRRVFRFSLQQFWTQYELQVLLETMQKEAADWRTASNSKIKADAMECLRTRGWKHLRPALGVTIRCLIIRGFAEGGFQRYREQRRSLSQALDLLEWGRQTWHNVPTSDRGVIFESTFIRAVRSLHLNAMMEDFSNLQSSEIEEILSRAEDIIRDVEQNPPPSGNQVTPGEKLAYFDYCKGEAYAAKGFYWDKKAVEENKGSEWSRANFRKSSEAYMAAAECFPIDDEHNANYFYCGVLKMFAYGDTIGKQLAVMEKVRESRDAMSTLWKMSPMNSRGRDKKFAAMFDVYEHYKALLASGKAKLDDIYWDFRGGLKKYAGK